MNGAGSSDGNPSGVQGVCPYGWHLPSDSEWKELERNLGMSQAETDNKDWRGTDEGGMLKEAGTDHRNSPNAGATNESGFTALPGGFRSPNGTFYGLGDDTLFWSTTEYNESRVWTRRLDVINAGVRRSTYGKEDGFSVRYVKNL